MTIYNHACIYIYIYVRVYIYIYVYIYMYGELQISFNIEGHQILAMHSYDELMYSFLLATHTQTNTLAQPDCYDQLWGNSPFLC